MQKQSPILRLWELGKNYHGGLIKAIFSAAVGVLCGLLPYFAAAQIIIGLLNGNTEMQFYILWCGLALAGFLLPLLAGPVHVPQGDLFYPEKHTGKDSRKTAENAVRHRYGHLQRPDEANHRRPSREYGTAFGPSFTGDDS